MFTSLFDELLVVSNQTIKDTLLYACRISPTKLLVYPFAREAVHGGLLIRDRHSWMETVTISWFSFSGFLNTNMAIMKHTLNSIYVIIDLLITATPVRFLHVIYPALLGKRERCLAISGLPWSMPNADQCRSKFLHWSQCQSIQINAQFRSMPFNFDQFRSIISIERHFRSMPWFWSTLGIDRWSLDNRMKECKAFYGTILENIFNGRF